MNKGFTLIEVLVYISLFLIIIGGCLFVVFQIIESSGKLTNKSIIQQEGNFLLRKIDWALTGANTVSISGGNHLTITKFSGAMIEFQLNGTNIEIKDGGSFVVLNNSNLKVTATTLFQKISVTGKPDAIQTKFNLATLDGLSSQDFVNIKYLRK